MYSNFNCHNKNCNGCLILEDWKTKKLKLCLIAFDNFVLSSFGLMFLLDYSILESGL